MVCDLVPSLILDFIFRMLLMYDTDNTGTRGLYLGVLSEPFSLQSGRSDRRTPSAWAQWSKAARTSFSSAVHSSSRAPRPSARFTAVCAVAAAAFSAVS